MRELRCNTNFSCHIYKLIKMRCNKIKKNRMTFLSIINFPMRYRYVNCSFSMIHIMLSMRFLAISCNVLYICKMQEAGIKVC